MDERFTIDIILDEKEYSFEAWLVTIGYNHRFQVVINGTEVIYEPDEERNYRATLKEAGKGHINDMDTALIKAVAEKIGSIRSEE